MLVNDGPYSGSPEGVRKQCDDVRSTISQMIQKRADCADAISDVRWQQMENALQERKSKLNNLQLEIETFWDAINKMDKALQNTESQIGKKKLFSLGIPYQKSSHFVFSPIYFSGTRQFDLFSTSTHRLYFGLNLTSTCTFFWPNLTSTKTSTSLLRRSKFDLYFSTNKKSRFYKMSKYIGRSKRAEVKRSK